MTDAVSHLGPWEIDTIVVGDCLDVMRQMPDGCVDLVVTDPPYGITACNWDCVVPLAPMWALLTRLAKENAAIVMTACQPFTSALGASNLPMLKYAWTWRKSRPSGHLNAKRMPLKDTEDVLVFYAKQPTYNPQGIVQCSITKKNTRGRLTAECFGSVADKDHLQTRTNYPRQVLDFASVHNVGALHPTQKPVALMEYLILTYTNPSDLIFDPFMGSGTTAVAAKKLGRRWFGCDISAEYVALARERVARVDGVQLKLLP